MRKKRAPRPRGERKPASKPCLPDDWREQTMLTLPQAAIVLKIGVNEAYAAANTDQIPVVRIGRSWRVPVPRLKQLLGEGA